MNEKQINVPVNIMIKYKILWYNNINVKIYNMKRCNIKLMYFISSDVDFLSENMPD